jgi:hypothetical protein
MKETKIETMSIEDLKAEATSLAPVVFDNPETRKGLKDGQALNLVRLSKIEQEIKRKEAKAQREADLAQFAKDSEARRKEREALAEMAIRCGLNTF